MVVTAWVMFELTGDRPMSVVDPIPMRGDNVAAVAWVNKCGGAIDRRACLHMTKLGRLEIKGGWSYTAQHIPGVQNTLAGGISRWPRAELAERFREATGTHDGVKQDIGRQGLRIFDVVLGTKHVSNRHDDRLWGIMVNGRYSFRFACTAPLGDHTAPPPRFPLFTLRLTGGVHRNRAKKDGG